MARTLIVATAVGANGGGVASITETAADQPNGMYFLNNGKCRLLCFNTNAATRDVTVVSVVDAYGRTGDKVITVPATTGKSEIGPFDPSVWNQTAAADLGRVHVNVSASAGLTLAVIQDP